MRKDQKLFYNFFFIKKAFYTRVGPFFLLMCFLGKNVGKRNSFSLPDNMERGTHDGPKKMTSDEITSSSQGRFF